jgi:hypothetical protein
MKFTSTIHDAHALEARLAAQLATGLSARIETLPGDVAERLRFAREQAVARARDVRRAAAGGTVASVSPLGVAALSGFGAWWPRAASALPLLVLVAGFLMIDQWSVREQVLAAAEIDARLLADDLPPAAYADPGFVEYLRTAPAP